jgi:hypothetical protein
MSHLLRQPAIDLFGDVVVTEADLFDWVAAVSPVHLSERAFDRYVKNYDVASKVRHAKLAGTFDRIAATPRHPWHARLALYAIL